jgi:O-6-methylguanine DNA methyltransferase
MQIVQPEIGGASSNPEAIALRETLRTSSIDSPIGSLRLASTSRGLAYVELPHASGRGLEGWLRSRLSGARCVEDHDANRDAREQILDYLDGRRTGFDLRLDLRGTAFQQRVWAALLEIPYGETRSYQQIARAIRRPRAVRAVGAANGANPVALVVPCHRVIASGGGLGGYGGGCELKARLLAMERGQRPTQGCLL